MAGRQALALLVEVRILLSQLAAESLFLYALSGSNPPDFWVRLLPISHHCIPSLGTVFILARQPWKHYPGDKSWLR